jgi:hypothetical protein
MSYQLTVEQRRTYVHSKVVGERTAENALRFLRDSYAACMNCGNSAVLLEVHLTGPSLTTTSVFDVILSWVPDALKLNKIAYVEPSIDDATMPAFLETVAVNRGVNVRLFRDVASAASWLSEGEAARSGHTPMRSKP